MFASKSAIFLCLVTISARLATAAPPSCILAAVLYVLSIILSLCIAADSFSSSEPNPADIPTICGPHASRVRAKLRELCNENVQAGLEAFDEVCKNVKGYKSTDCESRRSILGCLSITYFCCSIVAVFLFLSE